MATQEIGLVKALENAGIDAHETDLAELIIQLSHDRPSHIVVPALHRNRAEIRQIFRDHMPDAPKDLTDDPHELAEAARLHLRRLFLKTKVAVSGANFAIAETGGLLVAESEGNGRMCLTLPETLISVVGIEKLIPAFSDLEVFLQLLPRSATGERMNPYNSIWTGVTENDGPQNVHIVLLDNGRTTSPRRPNRKTSSAVHPLRGVPERVPGVRAHGRPRLRRHLPRSDRRDPDAADGRGRARAAVAVRVESVRRLLRGVPGRDRHPDRARQAPPRRGQGRKTQAQDTTFAAAATAMSGRRRWTPALKLAPLMRFIKRDAPPPLSALDPDTGPPRPAARVVPRLVDQGPE